MSETKEISPRLLSLSAAKLALLQRRVRGAQGAAFDVQTIPRRAGEFPTPLSFSQQRLWFLDQLEPGNPFYNISRNFRLTGPLDLNALKQSFDEIVLRHEVLRTRFVDVEGQPQQIVSAALSLSLPVVDLNATAGEAERPAEIMRLATEEARLPFDLETGPLVRVRLLRVNPEEHVLLLTLHHIIADGWSLGVLFTELGTLYEAFSRGQQGSLPKLAKLAVQYGDYAEWQRQWLTGDTLEKQLGYWREQLGGSLPVLELPAARPRPATQSFRGAKQTLVVSEELCAALKELSRREGVTLFMTLLAVFQTLLLRYTGQTDILIGCPVAGRNRTEIEGLIGFFVNTLVLRTDLSGDPTFVELLRRVREVALGAYAHQDLPFEKLVEEIQPDRSMSHTPLFQVLFTLQSAVSEPLALAGLGLRPFPVDLGTAIFDLTLAIEEQESTLDLTVQYNTDLFNPEAIANMLGHFAELLGGAAADAQVRLSQLPLLTANERERLLVTFNEAPVMRPELPVLHRYFERQAAQTPDAIAVICNERQMNYSELNRRANHLAHRLQGFGVGPEVLVGVCVERSVELVVALLAVLKAGGAYVPLDPAYPAERLSFTMRDAAVPVLVTQASLLPLLPAHEAQVICMDEESLAGGPDEEEIRHNLRSEANEASAENLAYLIYTSGSTGRPKGVAITHRSAVVLVEWALALYSGAELAGVLASTSICFDLSVFELFVPLSVGGAVILAENALQLPALTAASAVTLVNTVPSAMAELVRMGGLPASVQVVNLAGEALPNALAQGVYAQPGIERVVNLYGPSEDTTYSTWDEVKRGTTENVTIGKPLANTRAYLLDEAMGLVAVGVSGELYLGGDGLARGYLNRPKLTAASFVPDPFGTEAGGRLYKTGDLAKHLADGRIEFLGRRDGQVKIRGYRIELGEVETALVGHEAVREVVVIAREDVAGEKRLVAYIVLEPAETALAGGDFTTELRGYLKERLPEYMAPSQFVLLEALPLTPNGKLNRKALPEPEHGGDEVGDSFVAPRTAVEELVAGIWSEVLGVERVGVNDNFFSLGGHSLLATRIVSRVRVVLGVELSLRSVFEWPTVAGLSRRVEAAQQERQSEAAISRPQLRRREDLQREAGVALSFAQQRLWFLDQLEPGSPAYNVPSVFRLEGQLDVAVLEQALGEILKRHEALRTTFTVIEGEPVQVVAPPEDFKLSVTDVGGFSVEERASEAARLASEEAHWAFDLSEGPLVRVKLLRLGAQQHTLLVTAHHIVSDGWSIGIFLHELEALYETFLSNSPSPLQELPIQYPDFAAWEREWLRGDVLEAQLAYWRQRLEGSTNVLQLPAARPRPSFQTFRGAARRLSLPDGLTETLKTLSRREGVTLYMTLLAAFQTLLYRYTGKTDINIGTPTAGRHHVEVENLIGFFVNTLVLRADLSGGPTFRELLGRVRESVLEAYAHQDLPFEKLVEELQPERDMRYTPLFQVMFVLQNATPSIHLPGLTLSQMEVESATEKFDLTLSVSETERELIASLRYSTDLFDEPSITRMLQHFQAILESAVVDPESRLSDLPMLTGDERQQLLVEWNETEAGYPRDSSIPELFEQQAAETPDAIALVLGERRLTYAELNGKANQLAHHLQSLGVGPEVFVAVCLDRSFEMVIALLAVLKAGGAYVALDPAYPHERLSFMFSDADITVLLTQTHLLGVLPADGMTVICLDDNREEVSDEHRKNLPRSFVAEQLAYVAYTSGSTGRPKGVAVTHRGVVRLVKGNDYVSFGQAEVFLQLAPISFDASTLEIWGSLLNGARLVLMNPGQPTLEELGAVIAGQGVTTLWLTAGLFHLMVDEQLEQLAGLRQLLAGGDVLSVGHVREFLRAIKAGESGTVVGAAKRLVNGYGPTENTTFSCCEVMDAASEVGASVSIGRPIKHSTAYILDQEMELVPVGVNGELYLGGDGLARGYLNRPELTAEKFVPHPYSERTGERLYRTGDVARHLADGRIEFLGRRDGQVKIRGYRIEVGEVETALAAHAGVREVAVIAREDAAGDKRLVAYVVASERTVAPETVELQNFLKGRLPEYMVPSQFVLLEALPLTPNGKLDRKALPAPEHGGDEDGEGFVAPRTPVEELLAGIWSEVLGVDRVGTGDNFFALGGHSLLATRIVSRVRVVLGVELALRSVFEWPTVAGLSQRLEEALLAAGEMGHEATAKPRLERRVRDGEVAELSFAQQRLWFLDQLEPDSATYNIPAVLNFRGRLDVGALEQALSEITRRHEVLRTTFSVQGEQGMQVVHPAQAIDLPLTDLADLPNTERDAQASLLVQGDARRPFDLAQGPLLRTRLLRLDVEEHILLLTMHHIVADGWSLGVLLRELASLYEAFASGSASALPELPIQYADYAIWQRAWLQGSALERQLSYWRERLGGAVSVLELPADRARPPMQSFKGAQQEFILPLDLSAAINRLCRREGVTLFMTLLAAFQTLLFRYTGQADISTGVPIAGRQTVETEPLIGFFVNTLVLRTDLSNDPTFVELLQRVREVALGAYAHQDVPFEKLVEEIQPERSMSHTPLFQVMFSLQNAPMPEFSLQDLVVTIAGSESGTSKFDLTLTILENAGQLSGALEYSTDLFEESTIRRMLGHFEELLAGVAADPTLPLSALPLLTAAERHELLVSFNDVPSVEPRVAALHQLFEAQAAQTPDAVALVFAAERLTYAELNSRANELAHHLRSLGVAPEVLVGVCLDRSVEMVVALLAILKAGGAYVPLDPAYPAERLSFTLEDAAVKVLLTQARMLPLLPAHHAQLICLDSDWQVLAGQQRNVDNPPRIVTAENLAYVIYTSGSTGRPKGVGITHRSAAVLVEWARAHYSASELAGVLASTSICFDLSVFELFVPLSLGGAVILAADALQLSSLAAARSVTLVNTVPSAMTELVRMGGIPASVRVVNLAGEPLRNTLAQDVFRQGGVERVLNLYGPSEDTTYSTWAEVDRGATEEVTIGRPVANTRAYILDQEMGLAPVGVRGELYLGGDGLARGYLNRPELTAEKFVPDLYGHLHGREPGGRLYRTGDVARYLAGRRIEFSGREDGQVKIRGYRIELGEVETALVGHEAVREVVVIAREDVIADKRLVAYIVVEAGETAIASGDLTTELRSYLKERLPEHMVPSQFVLLEALPLTPNGKLDRKALPVPEQGSDEAGESFVAPRTAVEELVAGIWSEVLGVKRVRVTDNFFALGGHSLLATRIVSRVRVVFGVELPLRSVFEWPTVEGLSRRVEATLQESQSEAATGRPQLRREDLKRETGVALSFAQQRLWFLDQLEPGSSLYNIPQAIRLRGAIDLENLRSAFAQVVARHESLRTTFTTRNGLPLQVVAPPADFVLRVIDLSELPESEREAEAQRAVREEARRPFDLSNGPLLRALLLRLDAEEHVLLLTLHHIVSDGWSMGVLFAELGALYEAFGRGEQPRLQELPVQYADYAAWQRAWLSGDTLARQLGYWRNQLSGLTPSLNLPTDHPRPAVQTVRGARQLFSIPPSLTKSLRELSRREGVTLYMTLLAAFQTLLHRYSGQADIAVGSPIAGRTMTETEGLIGLFINTLVMRTDLSGEPTFRELLGRVRQAALGAYAHQDLPFEKLVEELQPERDLSRPPLFQVMFILQNTPVRPLALVGLTLEPLRVENETARFDLTLGMAERGEELLGELEYNADLFDAPTIERLLDRFTILVEGIAADADVPVSALPLLPEDESRRILVEWNETDEEYAAGKCVHELFEAQAALTPDAIAVEFRESAVSYAELNRRANQLARYLRRLGVGPEVLVGICVEKSIEMLVGLLGILKAGGAYVPLDPAFPAERLAFMSEDAALPVLVTQSTLTEMVPANAARRSVLLDADWSLIADELEDNPGFTAASADSAYVIYTSGSTGKPKGVQISHRAVVNFLNSMRERPGIKQADVLLAVTTLSFDIAGLELYLPLVTGARVVIASREEISDGARLSKKIETSGASIMQATPATWRLLLATGWQGKSNLRIFCGGEALPRELANQLVAKCAELWNLYGPTETTIWSAVQRVEFGEGIVSAGRPIANTRTYVLDENLRPVPIGIPGELFIGGDGLAQGYLNLQELTAEKFIPDAFGGRAGGRLYRTGDLARYAASGEIEILNRLDTQVKIRGFRIEPGEIEGALEQHPLIRQAIVIAGDEEGGEKRLIGYVVADPASTLTINELRRFLLSTLPDYMVPSAFVMLDEMPLTPNGKVNRRALPAPDRLRPELEEEFALPRTPVEEIVVGIWREVLGSERVGIHDNFFALGGHSLLATQVVTRVSEAFDIELPLRRLFEEPTVAGLAGVLASEPGEQARIEKTAALLLRLALLTNEEVEAMLSERAEPAMAGGVR